MGTRSTIAIELADGAVQQVYCHWDGYLSHNGKILLEHYSDPLKLQKLTSLGGISSLGREIGKKHPFSSHTSKADAIAYDAAHEAGWTTFYTRDRGEDLTVEKFKDFNDYAAFHQREEYAYCLRRVDGNATWLVAFDHGDFTELSKELAK